LGHLMVAALISDVEISQQDLKAIVRETIVRNVAWMLDWRGANVTGLSYMEPTDISEYRLKETFLACHVSYRILMFWDLFRRAAVGSLRKSLIQLRDEAFARHGAPPKGLAKEMLESMKKIYEVNSFPGFFEVMQMPKPCPQNFTSFLRNCVDESIARGYTIMRISQGTALPGVEVAQGVTPIKTLAVEFNFFPEFERNSSFD
jgi:hypothetical protein